MNYWKNVAAMPNCSKRICVLPLPFCPYLTVGWHQVSADHPSVAPAVTAAPTCSTTSSAFCARGSGMLLTFSASHCAMRRRNSETGGQASAFSASVVSLK